MRNEIVLDWQVRAVWMVSREGLKERLVASKEM